MPAQICAGHDWTTKTADIAPLHAGGSAGIAVLLAAIGMIMVGYVPLSGDDRGGAASAA